jgi:hypothetical protein
MHLAREARGIRPSWSSSGSRCGDGPPVYEQRGRASRQARVGIDTEIATQAPAQGGVLKIALILLAVYLVGKRRVAVFMEPDKIAALMSSRTTVNDLLLAVAAEDAFLQDEGLQ